MSSPSVRVQNGSLYLDASLYEHYFEGLSALGVVRRERSILLVALRAAGAGGSLAKVRNARGDRVIHARELLSELELDEATELVLAAEWDPELAALRVACPGPTGTQGALAREVG